MIQLSEGEYNSKVVGGKAANISKMLAMGLNVPLAFAIPTDHTFFKDFANGEKFETGETFYTQLLSHVRYLAHKTNTTWNSSYGDPLIVSVRSGAPISMPGMMDTILNVGLTKSNINRFVESRGATRGFALDCYRRLIQMYGVTVKGVDPTAFSTVYEASKTFHLNELNDKAYERMVEMFEDIYQRETGEDFPDDPNIQLLESCNAVFRSWFSEKAVSYRKIEGIEDNLGTAVTVQQMVFGNLDRSATGVAFTHNPNTGEKGIYGDYLAGAQGEDVVSGAHKVFPINEMLKHPDFSSASKTLQANMGKLLAKEKDILDIEFTIERGELYLLQYRVAKRSQRAEIRNLFDMVKGGEITSVSATERFMGLLPKPEVTEEFSDEHLVYVGKGIGATDGIVMGRIAVGHEQADKFAEEKVPYIYVASETAPEDSMQMKNSVGILTALGGKLSHAAVVARGWNKSCVVSLDGLEILEDNSGCTIHGATYLNGQIIKINGASGEVWA